MVWEAENCVHSDEYQYHRDHRRRQLASVSTSTRYKIHDHLVATGLCALHLFHSRTARMNSCLVLVGTTCVTKPVVSRLLSEILGSLCSCSIGNESQNTLVFSFFNSMHCALVRCVSSVTLSHPLYFCINIEFLDWHYRNYGRYLPTQIIITIIKK